MIFIRSKTTYNRFNSKQVPFIEKLGDSYMNGTWDVTDTKEFLGGIQRGNEEIRLKDYLVYRPIPKAFYKLGEKPKVHPQSYEMQVWYKDIYKALTEGVKIDKEYYNPFFVFWMLIFRFEIPMYDKKGNPLEGSEINSPVYSTIDRYIFDVMWRSYKKREYVGFISGRGIGKSFITSAIEAWYYFLFDKQELIISATSEPIVEEAWSKFRDTIDLIEEEFPGFHQKRIINSTKRVIAGEEYYDNNGDLKKRGSLNDARRIIYGDNANVTRGRRPHFQHVEEFASFPSHPSKGSLKNVLGQSKGSWLVMGSIKKAFVIMTGTGGSVDNKDAEDVFTNPKGFNMFSCEEWGKETSLFIPSYLKYGGTWEGVGTPNLELALDLITIKRKTLENDPVSYIKELQEFPISLDEVFIVHGLNIFNQDKIAEQLAKLKISKEKPWEVGKLEYVMNPSGKVVGVKFVKSPDGKIIIVEHPQTEKDGTILNNLYVTGIDSIDQGGKDSLVDGSKLAAAVKKRISGNMFSETSNLYVAFYNERSDDVRWDYENVLKIMMYYNSKANLEYTKINIVSFFRDKGQLWRLLKRPSIAIGANISGIKASQLIGTPATPSVISHQDQKWADYIDDYYYQIMYPPVLEQSRDYDRNNRTKYDFVVACGLTELADEDFLGKPASKNEKASDGLTDFGFYMDKRGKRRWGEIPKKEEELRSIAEETIKEMVNEENLPFRWVDSSSSMP